MCSTRVRRAFVSHSGCRGTRQMRPAVGDPTSLSTPAPADQLAASGERQWVGTGSYFTVAISGSYYRTETGRAQSPNPSINYNWASLDSLAGARLRRSGVIASDRADPTRWHSG
ncbi:hypothetical protein NP493_62g02000 [Ridgeia piscesae]|uniref:Uncharacterized protein n=1 Tax=Ridgeia piscesae TaxID=27915 RepID=A0AAD9UIW9_RIDPI|nr:hypothetical protein NP493_62g02000 [Ridgeia piscesae]